MRRSRRRYASSPAKSSPWRSCSMTALVAVLAVGGIRPAIRVVAHLPSNLLESLYDKYCITGSPSARACARFGRSPDNPVSRPMSCAPPGCSPGSAPGCSARPGRGRTRRDPGVRGSLTAITVFGPPEPGASSSPASPSSAYWRRHLTTVGSVHPARSAIWGPVSPSAVPRLFPPRQRHQPIDEGWRAGVPTVDDRLYALHPLRGHDMAFHQVDDQLLQLEGGRAPGARSARYRLGARSNRGRCRLRR